MPNHVFTEVLIPCSAEKAAEIKALCCNSEGKVDFEVLLPVPINYWAGSVGSQHKAFPGNALAWCTANWSTKWNAYGPATFTHKGGVAVMRLKTAWNTPLGWLCALFNTAKVNISYRYLDEGQTHARVGELRLTPDAPFSSVEWKEVESPADDDEMGALLWGDESWAGIKAERAKDDAISTEAVQ